MKIKLFLASLLIISSVTLSAQEGYIMKADSLHSDILGQSRKLNIFIPEGYDTCKTRFPVIYVLDADWRDQHVIPTIRFLNQNRKMPQALIVGVRNIDREHDFLPDSTKGNPTGGGAGNFIRFFNEELFPYIEKRYKAEPYKVLIGHSFGGLFALYAIFSQPDLFNAYIAMDPSVWYNNRKIVDYARGESVKSKNWDKLLFITGREGQGMTEMGIPPMDDLLKKNSPTALRWKLVAYPFEDHGSVTFKSVYDGLRFIFDTGGNIIYYPQSGIVPRKKEFLLYISGLNSDLHYTTDGTEPSDKTDRCTEKLLLKGACTVKISDTGNKYKRKPSTTVNFTEGDYFSSVQSGSGLIPGLKYLLYEGKWDSIPDLSRLSPAKSGICPNIELSMSDKKENYALRFEGFIKITSKDMYYPWIMSDENARMYINGILLLDTRKLVNTGIPAVSVIPLKPGYYPVVLEYFGKTGKPLSSGMVHGMKDSTPAPFSADILFHKE